ncbi:MAG: long-chain fatty acid--CoA ligase [Candidatus Obscuribacterales bacterium]|nr:long-chain fatty acid--CoA ligase [Candidatus Obscuribacterales bacterium]
MKHETIVHVFWERVKTMAERPAILHKVAGSYRPVIWREHGRVVELVAGALLKLGVNRGDKVSILSSNRPQWTWADMAILTVGGVTIPIYPTLQSPEVEYLVRHSDSVGIFVENQNQLNKLLSLDTLPPQLRFIVLMDGHIKTNDPRVKLMTFDDLVKDGEVYLPNNPKALKERIDLIAPDDMATIVYTSGTTGVPKGVMLLHRNIYSVCQAASVFVGFHADDVGLSFLPLAHVYERMCGQFVCIYEGFVMAYAESMETVAQNMMEVRPTVMNGVPRFFEKIYNRIQTEVRNMPQAQQYLIRWALALGKRADRYAQKSHLMQAVDANEGAQEIIRKIYRGELRVADRLVFSRIRRRFGGRLRFFCSGAAPLSPEVHLFFDTVGLPIVEGWGLTETAAPICGNRPQDNERGTVGRPLPGAEIKIAEDGEILVKGPSVFAGYYKDEEATKKAVVDGWFMTGDIGEFDSDGRLKITDRKKDIIITAGGKHVAPQALENLFVGEPLISHVLAYGDRRKYITALITLSTDGLAAFAKHNQITYSSPEELINHPLVQREVEAVVARKNQTLASFSQVKKFLILDKDFSIEGNELTPTLKVKRKVVTEKYKDMLDSLYETEDLQIEQGTR